SFIGRLRDECLNETLFTSLRQARAVLAAWQRDYNEVRPHSALRGLTPASIRLPSCSLASSPLRAGFAGGLRPGLTQAVRGGRGEQHGRDGETPLDQTEETPSRWAWRQPRTLLLSGGNLGLRAVHTPPVSLRRPNYHDRKQNV